MLFICVTCTQTFTQKRLLQRNCSRRCALIASKRLWGRFVYPRTKRSKEEGLIGNMIQVWPKSSHQGNKYTTIFMTHNPYKPIDRQNIEEEGVEINED